MAVAQRLLERRVQLLGRDLALLQVLRHQRLVDLDDLIDERAVRAAHRREVGLAVGVEEAVDDLLAAIGGQIDRQALLAEQRLDRREQRRQIDVLGVDLVDDDEPAEAALRRPIHHPRRDHLDAGLRADDDRRGLDGIERADRLPDEIGESGRVDEMDPRRPACRDAGPTRAANAARPSPADRNRSTVVPRSTVPASLMAPDASSSASASVVLPDPPWPTSATVRILPVA